MNYGLTELLLFVVGPAAVVFLLGYAVGKGVGFRKGLDYARGGIRPPE
jgi:hypothetical protein